MASVLTCKRKHWTGLDADKSSVTPTIGDTYAATDTGKCYYGNGSAWKTGLGYEFVNRLTNAIDFTETGSKAVINTDGTIQVNGLDLSSIVPVGAVAVVLSVEVEDDAAGSYINFYRDAAYTRNRLLLKTQVANISVEESGILAIDSDRLLDYQGSNLAFVGIWVTVIGWFI